MNGFKIEAGFQIDALQMVEILRETANFLESEGDRMEDRELMDGSYMIPTTHGPVFLFPICEEE